MTPPGHPAFLDDPSLAPTLEAIEASIRHYHRQLAQEGKLDAHLAALADYDRARRGERPAPAPPAAAKGPKRRKKDPHPDQAALFTTTGDDSDGRYD